MVDNVQYWPTALPQSPLTGHSGGPVDDRVSFQTEKGAPIVRRNSTGEVERWSMEFRFSLAEYRIFYAWQKDNLKNRSLRFAMRDPFTDDLHEWIFSAGEQAFQFNSIASDLCNITLTLTKLPSVPWFAPYVPANYSAAPQLVLDYENDVFGVNGITVSQAVAESTTPAWLTQGVGTFVIANEYTAIGADNLGLTFRVDDGGTTNLIQYGQSEINGNRNVLVRNTSVDIFAETIATAAPASVKTVMAYADNDFAVAYDGTTLLTDNSGIVPLGLNSFVPPESSAEEVTPSEVHVTQLTYFNERLPNAVLRSLAA